MSRNTRIALLIVIAIIICCLCTCVALTVLRGVFARQFSQWAEQNMTTDSAKVGQLASGIARFDPPAGFTPAFGMSFFGTTMAGYQGAADSHSLIMLMQFPAGLKMDQASMEAQINQAMARQNSSVGNAQMTMVDQRQVTVRGQPATLTISEGTTGSGLKVRQAMVFFEGDGGPAALIFTAPADQVSADSMAAFVQSIR